MSIKIGITETATNYANYVNWIRSSAVLNAQEDTLPLEVEIVELSYTKSNAHDLSLCDGIVFTGGVDIHPGFHSCNYSLHYPFAPEDFNVKRDEFELNLLEQALSRRVPILGICRGLQLINSYMRGTLHLDNGSDKNAIHKKEDDIDKQHMVSIDRDSLFYDIVQADQGMVNSAHHQSIDKLAKELVAVAFSDDGVVEAIELRDPKHQFLCAVQWHPERMLDVHSPFSMNIKKAFLAAAWDKRKVF